MKQRGKLFFSGLLLMAAPLFSQQTEIVVASGINGTTFNTCNGFIIDSGDQGGTGYSDDEDVVFTICPDNPDDVINVTFNLFNLDTYDENPLPDVTDVDVMMVYDGSSASANLLGEYTGTQLQGVLIQCSSQNTSGCLTFRFVSNNNNTAGGFYSGSAQCIAPCHDPVASGRVLSGFTNDSIHACIGETLNFEDIGSFAQPGFTLAGYEWDFMDGATATGQNVTHTYFVPGHYRVQLFVTDNNGCRNNNLTDIDVLIATPPDFSSFQKDTTLCVGESLQVVATPLLYENTWSGFSGSATIDDGCLSDSLLGIAQNIEVTQSGFTSGGTIDEAADIVSLCLEIEHSYMGDLIITVTCPNGQNVTLHQQGGGGTQLGIPVEEDNVNCNDPSTKGAYYNYCFDNSSTQTWADYGSQFGNTLPEGNYEPIQPLSNLVGCPANGVWTLTVVDNWQADDGSVLSFSIQLDSSFYTDVVEFTPGHIAGSDSSYWTFPAPFASNLSSDGDQMTITPTVPGSYTYMYNIVNSFGCQNDTSFTIGVYDFTLPVNLVDTTVCAGNLVSMINPAETNCNYTLNLFDSSGDGWNGNNLFIDINGVQNVYTMTNGANATFQIPVSFGDQIDVYFDDTGALADECAYEILNCQDEPVYQSASPPSTAPFTLMAGPFTYPVSFEWSPAGIFGDFVNAPNPQIFITDNISASVNVYPTGHPLCAETDALNITILPDSYIGVDSTVSICQTSVPEDLFNYLGPGANPAGTWEDPTGNPVTMPVDPVSMPEGGYVYTVDNNGCVGFATITVMKTSPVILDVLLSDATCVNAANGSAVVTAQNFTTYAINNGPHIPVQSPFTIPDLGEGNYDLTLYGTSVECAAATSFFVNDPDSLSITLITDTATICDGASTSLTVQASGGSSPYIYAWTLNGAPVSDQQTFTVTPPFPFNNYCVTLTEQCNSTSLTECTVVQFEPNLIPQITTDNEICVGDTNYFQNVTNNPNVLSSLVWFGDGDSLIVAGYNAFMHVYTGPGSYNFNITSVSVNGCVYSNFYSNLVQVRNNPSANFTVAPDILTTLEPNAGLVNISSGDAISFSWYMPGSIIDTSTNEFPKAEYPFSVPGEYPVKLLVTNQYGCSDSITRVIRVEDVMSIYIPNSFTPNGDEFNNTWKIVLNGIDILQFRLTVYNRWGQPVFESRDPAVGWDGTFNNQLVQAGLYQWKIEGVESLTGLPVERYGYVNIFR